MNATTVANWATGPAIASNAILDARVHEISATGVVKVDTIPVIVNNRKMPVTTVADVDTCHVTARNNAVSKHATAVETLATWPATVLICLPAASRVARLGICSVTAAPSLKATDGKAFHVPQHPFNRGAIGLKWPL